MSYCNNQQALRTRIIVAEARALRHNRETAEHGLTLWHNLWTCDDQWLEWARPTVQKLAPKHRPTYWECSIVHSRHLAVH